MARSPIAERKHKQKETHLFKQISQLFASILQDEPTLQVLHITKVELSQKKGTAYVYFYTSRGATDFDILRPKLILYKPSIRKALSKLIPGRYIPDLKFVFDLLFEKQRKIDDLLVNVGQELKTYRAD